MTDQRPVFAEQQSVDEAAPNDARGWLRRKLTFIGKLLLIVAAAVAAAWSTAAVYYTDLPAGTSPRTLAAILFGGVCVVIPILVRSWRLSVLSIAVMSAVVMGWFFTRTPLQSRNWTADVARAPLIDVNGDLVTIHDVRNFDYRSESIFTPRWDTRTYDLSKIKTVDYILSHWDSDAFAHVIISFGFEGGKYLAVSIETRKEQGEAYSAVQGFFRQYELAYVFADERDVLRLRTKHRNENVYMFRLRTPPDRARQVLLSYVNRANQLATAPEFYNALTSNCSTNVIYHFNDNARATISPWHIGLMLNGYSPRLAYDAGSTDTSLPYQDLRKMCHINAAANDAALDDLYSHRIRVGLPDPTLLR